jgi:GntR family transcriptional regulator, transcriptional repressor for pyruvate dehydrogenase complex
MSTALRPVRTQSVSDAVFEQLRNQIVSGAMSPGSPLPAERELCEALGVNRGSIREALKRLQQSHLVSVRHGGTSHVLDYRASAGLDLLADLIITPAGRFDVRVVRGIVEMRSALAPDIARLAAERARSAQRDTLERTATAMEESAGDLPALQGLAADFWSHLVDASDNLAYRLAYNSLRATYDHCRELFTQVMAEEIADVGRYRAIATAVRRRDAAAAERLARELIQRGERGIKTALRQLDEQDARA